MPEKEPQQDKEQTSEEITTALESALENETEAKITVVDPNGESGTVIVSPAALEKDVLWVITDNQAVIPIEYGRIKKVELPE